MYNQGSTSAYQSALALAVLLVDKSIKLLARLQDGGRREAADRLNSVEYASLATTQSYEWQDGIKIPQHVA
jgi:hypothetical protein